MFGAMIRAAEPPDAEEEIAKQEDIELAEKAVG